MNTTHESYREKFEARKKKDLIIKIIAGIVVFCLLIFIVKKIKYSDFIISQQEKGSKITSKELSENENYYSVALDSYIFDDISSTRQIGKNLELSGSDENLTYNISYCSIGSSKIDKNISDFVVSLADKFKKDYSEYDAQSNGRKVSLMVECQSFLAGDSIVSFVFFENYDSPEYDEPVQKVETFSYMLKTEEEIVLEDIMKGDYLKVLSDKTKEYLLNDVRFIDTAKDGKFKNNYKASEENFKMFALSKASLILYFEPYRIAPSEYGIVSVELTADEVRSHMKFNPFKYVKIPSPASDDEVIATDGTAATVGEEDAGSVDNIDPDKPMVAFTFDDGPRAESTGRILDTLEKYGCHATFFLVGNRIEREKEIVKREYDLGCDVGNHSFSHAKLSELKPANIESQIERTNKQLEKIIGTGADYVRTPYGEASSKVLKHVDYPIILWDVDTLDWKSRKKNKIIKKLLGGFSDGDIILMHDIYDSTADAFEKLVPLLIDKGYQIVSVSELFKYRGVKPEKNKTYYSIKKQ